MATIDIVYNRHVQLSGVEEPPAPGDWQDAYDLAYTTGAFTAVDDWYDANTGRTSTEDLWVISGQATVNTTWFNTNSVAHPANVFMESGRWIIQDVQCSNMRFNGSINNITVRQCLIERNGASFLYCLHAPSATPAHGLIFEDNTIDGQEKDSYAVYFPATNYVEDDIIVRRNKFTGWQSGIHATWGITAEYNLISDLYYFTDEGGPSHNTAMSFRGGWGKAIRNRVRPGVSGSSGINFYAELGPDYDHLFCVENLVHADNATVTVQFPDEDDPSILFSDPFTGMTRQCIGNIIDERFSNPLNWVAPGNSIGVITDGSGIAGNIHWDGSEADDGSPP